MHPSSAEVRRFAIAGAAVITPQEELPAQAVIVGKGLVEAIVPRDKLPRNLEVEDLGDAIIAPGFVDGHIHGIAGHDAMDASVDSLHAIAGELVRYGVTGFAPSTFAHGLDLLSDTVAACERAARTQQTGARILGMHIEGPFISTRYAGAQPKAFILRPNIDAVNQLLNVAPGRIAIMTLAPELPGAEGIVRRLREAGVTPSIGHSSATYQQVMASVEWGIRHVTHVFNAMSQLTQREPGVVGAVLHDHRLSAELIADGIHVHPVAMRILLRCRGAGSIVLVTESIRANRLPDGYYEVAGQIVNLRDGVAKLDDGTLAGSCMTLDEAVRNAVAMLSLSAREAIAMATLNAVAPIRGAERLGRIAIGGPADLVVLSPDLTSLRTYVGGRLAYQRPGAGT